MLLAMNIGNTHTVFGFYRKAKRVAHYSITTARALTADEFWMILQHFIPQTKGKSAVIDGVVIASVVPSQTKLLALVTEMHLKIKPVIVSGGLDIGMPILYEDPVQLGADRICNSVAAWQKYKGPAIIVDLGTAITYDVISRKGEFLGGAIAPGFATAARALNQQTAQLPAVSLQEPEMTIGKTTLANIQSGVVFGTLDAMEGMIRRIKRIVGKHAIVIATGGDAEFAAGLSEEIKYVEPTLTLDGARLIYERVKKT